MSSSSTRQLVCQADFSDSVGLEAWVKHNGMPRGFQRYVTVFGGLAVLRHTDGGTLNFYVRVNDEFQHLTIKGAMQPDTWHHVVGTYDGLSMKLYIDGQLVATAPLSGVLQGSGDQVLVSSPDEAMDGYIDEVAVYNLSLGPEVVRQHYQAGTKGRGYPGVGGSYDGVRWEWRFGDGQTSKDQNPTHLYEREGSYIVSLTMEEADGGRDSWSRAIQLSDGGRGPLRHLMLLAVVPLLLAKRTPRDCGKTRHPSPPQDDDKIWEDRTTFPRQL